MDFYLSLNQEKSLTKTFASNLKFYDRVATKIFEDFDAFWSDLPLKKRFSPDKAPSEKDFYQAMQVLQPNPYMIDFLARPPPQGKILPIESKLIYYDQISNVVSAAIPTLICVCFF